MCPESRVRRTHAVHDYMSLVARNLVANFAGRIVAAVVGIAFVPVYARLLGIEAYGLIGFFVALQSVFALLDVGLSATLNREMARYSTMPDQAEEARDLVRTMEVCYVGAGLAIGAATITLSPLLADWVRAARLSETVIVNAILLMGLVLAAQWPLKLFEGGLYGLQRQVQLNVVSVIFSIIRSAGAVVVLLFVSRTIGAFLLWQLLVVALQTVLTRALLWREMPAGRRSPRFRAASLRSVWRFAAGMTAISAATILLTQADRLVLSRLLTLEAFGYYTIAAAAASGIYYLIGPLHTAVYPQLTRLVQLGDQDGLVRSYHAYCQLAAVVILPAAAVMVMFAPQLMLLWTRDTTTVANTHLVLSLLVAGTALNAIMHLPYALQLAHGWTRLTFATNVFASLTIVPLMIFLAQRMGAAGAALAWLILNTAYVLGVVQIMHARLLPAEKWRWYLHDVGMPLVTAIVVAAAFRAAAGNGSSYLADFGWIVAASAATLTATALATREVRRWLTINLLMPILSLDRQTVRK